MNNREPTIATTIRVLRTCRVELADVDAHGVARTATYLRWMEETEYGFLRSVGLSVSITDQRGRLGFPRTHVAFAIRHPAKLDDCLTIELVSATPNGKTIRYEFQITRNRATTGGTQDGVGIVEIATGQFTVACCRFPDDRLPYAVLIPDWIANRINGAATVSNQQSSISNP